MLASVTTCHHCNVADADALLTRHCLEKMQGYVVGLRSYTAFQFVVALGSGEVLCDYAQHVSQTGKV